MPGNARKKEEVGGVLGGRVRKLIMPGGGEKERLDMRRKLCLNGDVGVERRRKWLALREV